MDLRIVELRDKLLKSIAYKFTTFIENISHLVADLAK